MSDIYTSSGNVASIILSEMIDTRVLQSLGARATIAPLVRNIDAQGVKSATFSIACWPSLTASTIGETADLSSTAFTPTDINVTYAEVGLMSLLTDKSAALSTPDDLVGQIAGAVTQAIERKVDTTLSALFAALNGGTKAGTTNTALTTTLFLSAVYALEANNYQGPMALITHPIQTNQLRQAVTTTTAIMGGNPNIFGVQKAQENGYCGDFFQVGVFQTTSVGTTTGATADKAGALIALGDEWSPLALVTWRPVRTELQRDASRRATEVNVTSAFGAAEQRDKTGICVISKGS